MKKRSISCKGGIIFSIRGKFYLVIHLVKNFITEPFNTIITCWTMTSSRGSINIAYIFKMIINMNMMYQLHLYKYNNLNMLILYTCFAIF